MQVCADTDPRYQHNGKSVSTRRDETAVIALRVAVAVREAQSPGFESMIADAPEEPRFAMHRTRFKSGSL
uniref:Uncharacterized protein n=1 Tax=Ralstonia solanacearum TaxID=305 RepID=A0A0S4UFF5_RALSL|nr:protein of unknown function [Ralstonia solanacearum]